MRNKILGVFALACAAVITFCAAFVPGTISAGTPLDISSEVGDFTGIAEADVYGTHGWWYVKEGVIMYGYDGFGASEDENIYYYVEGGLVDRECEGAKEGVIRETQGFWYVKEGMADLTVNGLVPTVVNGSSGYYVVAGGKVDLDAEGLYEGSVDGVKGRYYAADGKVDLRYCGFAALDDGYGYVMLGRFQDGFTGIAEGEIDGTEGEWYVKDGMAMLSYTGFVTVGSDSVYVMEGLCASDYTGLLSVTVDGVDYLWYLSNGALDVDFEGLVEYGGNWYYVKNGQAATGYTGIAEGSVDGGEGAWYVIDGVVDREYSGTEEINGTVWVITDGLAEEQESEETYDDAQDAQDARAEDAGQAAPSSESGRETDPVNYVTSGVPLYSWEAAQYMGRLTIPGAGIDVGLYYETGDDDTNQSITDRNDSAVFMVGYGHDTPMVADHVNQGFADLGSVSAGDLLCITTPDGTVYRYKCTAVGSGRVSQPYLYDENGNAIDKLGSDYLCCYTCDGWPGVTYALFLKG